MGFDPVEQIGEDGGRGRASDQSLGLERLDTRLTQMLGFRIEQLAVRATDAIGAKRLFKLLRLEQHGQAGQRPLRHRCRCERVQRSPEMLLGLRI